MTDTLALETEQAMIGLLLAFPEIRPRVSHLPPAAFAEPVHSQIWKACLDLALEGHTAPTASLIGLKIGPCDRLNQLGGGKYLNDLAFKAPAIQTLPGYDQAIIRLWQKRQLQQALHNALVEISGDPLDDLAKLHKSLDNISLSSGASNELTTANEAAVDYFDNPQDGGGLGLACGLSCIDRRLGGLKPGNLVVIGGRPGMGKTSLARNILYGAAALNPKLTFIFVSLEMNRNELTERAVAAQSYQDDDVVSYSGLGKAAPHDRRKYRYLAEAMPTNVRIDDRTRISVDDIRRAIWRIKSRGGKVGAVVIDYLQLMTKPITGNRNEAGILGDMTAELKRIAGETGATIILLSQLNRSVEGRDDKRPMLSDLRESGAIEQDANSVLFTYRDAYYRLLADPKAADKDKSVDITLMEVICSKNRAGKTGTDRMIFLAEYDSIKSGAGGGDE